MLGMLINPEIFTPIVTNADYNCYMSYRHRLESKLKGEQKRCYMHIVCR
jgi:hypothetical protein